MNPYALLDIRLGCWLLHFRSMRTCITHYLRKKKKSYPDSIPSYPDSSLSYPDSDLSNPDSSLSYPDSDLSYPDSDLSNPDSNLSYPDSDWVIRTVADSAVFFLVFFKYSNLLTSTNIKRQVESLHGPYILYRKRNKEMCGKP